MAKLNLVDVKLDAFASLITEIIETGTINSENLATLDVLGLAYLKVQNKFVNRVASDYGGALEDLPLIRSITIDVAGRQRMLSQKAAKEFCLIDAGINPEANRENLTETVRIFTNTLNALTEGFPGLVMPPPNPSILAKLNEVKAAWLVPSAVLSQIANGAEVTQNDRAIIEAQIERVLTLMNEAVGMYELGN
ncbi:MAG: type IV pili methyl-accepting chemotaxis transducer N-terminal domain-containing protein [Rhodobacteraceae bacterium]|nr:type IV pili methyl-accepting chemotaxis transducer N-terminal domain-containing protein [Paracoccaceae bacterium]